MLYGPGFQPDAGFEPIVSVFNDFGFASHPRLGAFLWKKEIDFKCSVVISPVRDQLQPLVLLPLRYLPE